MNLGNCLFHSRKNCKLSQEEVADKLGVNRRTISEWESNETIPDIYQAKKLAKLYNITLDKLTDCYDETNELNEIQKIIAQTDEKTTEKIDWTSAWGKKYPVLIKYQKDVNIPYYSRKINAMLDELVQEYHYSEQDAMLVLKDVLYQTWKDRKNNSQ